MCIRDRTPPAAVLIKKACGIEKASGVPNKDKVATITKAQVQQIAETKKMCIRDRSILEPAIISK